MWILKCVDQYAYESERQKSLRWTADKRKAQKFKTKETRWGGQCGDCEWIRVVEKVEVYKPSERRITL